MADVGRSILAVVVIAAVVLAGLSAIGVAPRAAAALAAHAPISIVGNAGFNATNGVIGGTGTAADPYVIAGWTITAPPAMGVEIRNTNAHVVVRDVEVNAAPVAGFYTYAVSNASFSNVTAFAGTGDGLRFESSHDLGVAMSNVTGNAAGIVLVNSVNVSLVSNNLTLNGGDGVTVAQSTAVLVQGNDFYYDAFGVGYGLDLSSSTNVTVRGNHFAGNSIYLEGAAADAFDSHTITPDNLVSGLPILYEAKRPGLALNGLQLGELLLASCAHARVSNVTTSGGDLGVEVAYASDVTLGPDLTLSNAGLGLRVVASTGVRFVDGAILDTADGARIESSTDVALQGTKLSSPFLLVQPGNGVTLLNSQRVNLSGNVVRHYLTGVSAADSGNLSLLGSLVSQDTQGVALESVRDLLAAGNVLSQDGTGLRADLVTNATIAENAFEGSGEGVNLTNTSGLRFVHNAFLGNPTNALDANGTMDAWDGGYPTGGNFWWTYHGNDLCSGAQQNICTGPDGIGDTWYQFDVGAVDHYPLMQAAIPTDVPPEALFLTSSLVGTVRTSFMVTANLSSDYEDPLSLLQVRWDWEGNGTWTPWSTVKVAWHMYATPGFHTISLEVQDRTNLTDTWSSEVYVAPKPDNLPPSIVTTPPGPTDVGQPIRVVANIRDPSGVANATLLYRGVDGGPFVAIPMAVEGNGTNFTATIPAQAHAGAVEYVIVANDTWANEARAPLSGTSSVAIVDPLMTVVVLILIPGVIVAAAAVVGFLMWRRRRARRKTPPVSSEGQEPPKGS